MNAAGMVPCEPPHELFSLRVDVCHRDATDFPFFRQIDHAEVPKLRHDQTRQVSESRFVVERATENPTRLGEKGKSRARRFCFATCRLCLAPCRFGFATCGFCVVPHRLFTLHGLVLSRLGMLPVHLASTEYTETGHAVIGGFPRPCANTRDLAHRNSEAFERRNEAGTTIREGSRIPLEGTRSGSRGGT
jgi:hypothetical protein